MTENTAIIKIIDEITACRNITIEQLHMLLETDDMQAVDYLRKRASEKAHETYGNQVFIRGLIEFTNYCKNDCLYCGIRHSNTHADRYRLSTEQIMACCESGYELGFRTFVLQGGEDPYYTDERICEIVSGIKAKYPDCAVTLSIGEKSKESYQSYFDAGADRYLLRHETADEKHYSRLHPAEMSLANRKQCLWDLKEIGYQVGCGFMVGSPGQKNSFTSAVFKTRIYQKYVHKDKKKAANFLLGVLMYYDCLSICEFKKTEALEEVQFVIAGKRIIAQAVYDILTDIMQEKKVHLLDEDELLAAKGAFRLAELYYKWKEGE